MSVEQDKLFELGDAIKIGDDELFMKEEDVELYNLWVQAGANLPFIYFDLVDKDGKKRLIHASKIRAALKEDKKE